MDKIIRLFLSVRAVNLPIRYAVCALLLALGGWAPGARAGMITIDDFSHPNPYHVFMVISGTDPSQEMTHSSINIIGGQRDMLVSVMGPLTPNSALGVIGLNNAVNALLIGTNGLSPTVTTLQYSGLDLLNTPTSLVNAHALGGGAGLDLTGGGTNDRFLIQFISSDAQPTLGLDLAVTITSPGGKSSTATGHAQNLMSAFDVYIPFSGLVGNASISQADSITFVFNGADKTPNVDYEIKMLATVLRVPEPASGTLMMTALGIMGPAAYGARRRRKKSFCTAKI